MTAEMVVQAAGLHMQHVPYRGAPYVPLITGEVHAMLDTMPNPLPMLQAGKLRALAVTGATRLPGLPDVPTFAELGIAGIDSGFWWGIVGPAGLPKPVVDRLNNEIRQILAEPAVRAVFGGWQIETSPGSPEAFGAHISTEYRRWKDIVAKSGLPLE